MGHLLGIRIQRYKALRDVVLGRHEYGSPSDPLPSLACLIGPNGSGKSTLLDAFGFLADCLLENVEAACDKPQRGGFQRLRTTGTRDPMAFDLYYQEEEGSRPITYSLGIDEDGGVPVAAWEVLRQGRQTVGRPWKFVDIAKGRGIAWSGEATATKEGNKRVGVQLEDRRKLAITTLGQLKDHPRVAKLRAFIEGWFLSYFLPDAARSLPMAGAQKHLDRTGENLANVVQYMERQDPAAFSGILGKIARRIPGIRGIRTAKSADGRLLPEFNEQGFKDPHFAADMSDGTLKMFTYLLLLADPEPRPFIGIEEPENGLYHRLVERLAGEFKTHAAERGTNVLVTTHSPYFVDALLPEQVWLIQRDDTGFANLQRAADIRGVKDLVEERLPLGSLWYGNHLGERVSP